MKRLSDRDGQSEGALAPGSDRKRPRFRALSIVGLLISPLLLTGCQETTDADRATALTALNDDRKENGVASLKLNETLNIKADEWATNLRDRCVLEHSILTEGTSDLNWQALGENVGYGPSIRVVQDAFMNSPAHRASILRESFEVVGIGVAHGECDGKDRTYVVQVFADLQ